MAKGNKQDAPKTCFVVMGFGKKTDFETGRVLDLDKSYRNMIKPAVEAAGLKCVRADEIVHSGLIDVPMYEQLLKADVVVADLSTSNKNAYYELGIRHALRPFTTVIISEDAIKTFPFDVNHVAVRQYHHLGDDIGYEEVVRFRKQLTKAIKEIINKDPKDEDSPVYTYLKGLTPPALAAAVQSTLQVAIGVASQKKKGRNVNDNGGAKNKSDNDNLGPATVLETHSELIEKVNEAQKNGNWEEAKRLLVLIRKKKSDELKKQSSSKKLMVEQSEDSYILQRLALVTYKSKPNDVKELDEACKILQHLNPSTSNDPETLGLWGAVHKRLWELNKNTDNLDEAIRAYERGFYIRNDYYNGINYAFLLNVRADQASDTAEAIADFVEARRVRKEVLSICEQWLKVNPLSAKAKQSKKAIDDYMKSWYWVMATVGETHLGMGEEKKANKVLKEVFTKAPESWMRKSTEEQIAKLKPLLERSPLEHIA
jgi:hypothetical protein